MSDASIDRRTPPEPAPLRPFDFPAFSDYRLENGVRLLHAPVPALPIAVVGVLMDGGAAVERPDQAGVANLVAELLDTGTGDLDSAAVAERFESLGLRFRAHAGWDELFASLAGPVDAVEEGVDLFSRLVRKPAFPADELERVRAEELAEIRQRRADPRSLGTDGFRHFLYADSSPFHRSASGTERALSGMSRGEVRDFHRRWVVPERTTLIIVGDVSGSRALRWAQRGFGAWTGGAPEMPEIDSASRSEEATVTVIDRPGAVQSEIRAGQIGVPRRVEAYIPLRVMNTLLGGAFSSRLNLNLRERHGFTYGASSVFAFRRHPGPFLVSTAVQTEVTGAALTEIFVEVRRMRSTVPGEQELSDIRSYLAGTYPLRLQTVGGVASRLGDLALHDLEREDFDRFQERVLSVEPETVREVADRFLAPDRFTVVVAGDADRVAPQLEALGHAPVSVVSPDVLGRG